MAYPTVSLEDTRAKHPETARKYELTVKHAPDYKSSLRIVGSWLWLDLAGQKVNEATAAKLELIGWKWNETRELYQNACGSKRRWRRSSKRYEPRDRYGNARIAG